VRRGVERASIGAGGVGGGVQARVPRGVAEGALTEGTVAGRGVGEGEIGPTAAAAFMKANEDHDGQTCRERETREIGGLHWALQRK
jgi:hypothetical protein